MRIPRAFANRRRLLTAALAVAVGLATGGFSNGIGDDQAATPTATLPTHRVDPRRTEPSPARINPAIAEKPGVLLYFLMEAARPQPLFAR